MYVMQMLYLRGIKNPLVDETDDQSSKTVNIEKKFLKDDDSSKKNSPLKIKSQLKNTDQIRTSLKEQPKQLKETQIKAKINVFEDIVQLANQENEIELKYDLERNVKLVNFKNGSIDISFNLSLIHI